MANPQKKNIVFLWYGKGHGPLLSDNAFETTKFSPDIPTENRDCYKTVVKLAKNTNLRAYHAFDTYDYRIFTYDHGEYIKKAEEYTEKAEGKLQTNIILFNDRKAGVRTINVKPSEDRAGKCQYWLDSIEGFKTRIILEEWNGEKPDWHLREDKNSSQ